MNENLQYMDTGAIDKPPIILRIKSAIVDTLVVIALMSIITIVLTFFDISSGTIRGFALGIILLYEPIAINRGKTVGQLIIGIRVCDEKSWTEDGKIEQISLLPAIFRFVLKVTLGWLSLVTIHSNPLGQAIHDQAASSIVMYDGADLPEKNLV